MISSLRGIVLAAAGSRAVIEVGGVGFAVQITPEHALGLRVGHEASMLTSLVVREDSLALFGFAEPAQLELFELLTAVTGVGPKSAMGVLAVLAPDQIADAVAAEDDAVFRKVSGIGPKTAKLIVVSLTGKVFATKRAATSTIAPPVSTASQSVITALTGLGWSERVAQDVVAETLAENPDAAVPALLRLALGRLGPASGHTVADADSRSRA
ncbi:MAG TPA: Holliday junction branch migration protein RuvA [Humibacter sp.]|nr:Holliday junction branch migration protein RuvA [Humibacter sp.]